MRSGSSRRRPGRRIASVQPGAWVVIQVRKKVSSLRLRGSTVTNRPPWESMCVIASVEASLQSATYRKSGVPVSVTRVSQVGMWVGSSLCSFPVSVYGAQAGADPNYSECGNGIRQDGKTPIQNDITSIAALFDETYQAEWVKHTVAKYGRADQGGVAIWSLDNAPAAWPITHRDIHPLPQTYQETWDMSRTYAQAVKAADPAALVMSPAQPYWAAMFYSSLDFVEAGIMSVE